MLAVDPTHGCAIEGRCGCTAGSGEHPPPWPSLQRGHGSGGWQPPRAAVPHATPLSYPPGGGVRHVAERWLARPRCRSPAGGGGGAARPGQPPSGAAGSPPLGENTPRRVSSAAAASAPPVLPHGGSSSCRLHGLKWPLQHTPDFTLRVDTDLSPLPSGPPTSPPLNPSPRMSPSSWPPPPSSLTEPARCSPSSS